jgi:hypothetical protein
MTDTKTQAPRELTAAELQQVGGAGRTIYIPYRDSKLADQI